MSFAQESPRRSVILMLAAVFFAGLATLSLLPPFEGADETAHWSYIQQLSDTGRAPRAGLDHLSRDLDRYAGPRPYSDSAPFEQTGALTYRAARSVHFPAAAGPTRFAQGDKPNWESQHPPLYYLLMTPVYRASHGLNFKSHIALLRLATWMMAFVGLASGVILTARLGPPEAAAGALIMAAWPFLAPQFFPTMARLGNDSLCLLEMGAIWPLILISADRVQRPWAIACVGGLLGLGLLTKAFFLPITVGVSALYVVSGWRSGRVGAGAAAGLGVALIALAVGGWWYVAQYSATGDLTGGGDFVQLKKEGGLVAGLAKQGSALAFLRGFAAMIATFSWTGTWSLARLPEVFILGPVLLTAVPLFRWARTLGQATPVQSAPAFLTAPLLASLIYHIAAFVALTGRGASTPGYYLHILAPALGFAVAIGWRNSAWTWALGVWTALFTLASWFMQASMFGGCAAKLGRDSHFTFSGAACTLDTAQLALVSFPLLAAISALLALGLIVYVIAAARSSAKTQTPDELIPLI